MPIFPLIEYEKCDVIFFISLSNTNRNTLQSNYLHVKYLHRIYQYNIDNLDNLNEYEVLNKVRNSGIVNLISPPKQYPIVFLIEPTEKLGGWIKGTLNFNMNYALKIFNLGYTDGTHFLKNLSDTDFSKKENIFINHADWAIVDKNDEEWFPYFAI